MEIRFERPTDKAAVRRVNEAAFDTPLEAALVDALREEATPLLSLVAEFPEEAAAPVVGHILFSPVTCDGAGLPVCGLAPMAVLPEWQRRGVGSALVRAGLEACRRAGFGGVVVLGHPDYYPRFGFAPASRFGLRCEYDVPDEVFMALELEAGALTANRGTIRYHPAFERTGA